MLYSTKCLKMVLEKEEKNSMTRPCHPIYAQALNYQVFSPCNFHVSIFIETLESDTFSVSTPSRTEW